MSEEAHDQERALDGEEALEGEEAIDKDEDDGYRLERAVQHARNALTGVCGLLPHLSGLAALVYVAADDRVETACIFASGRLLVNPDWFLALPTNDAIFVMAHELMHLALKSHERMSGGDMHLFNVAHDLIINDLLSTELGCPVPAGGLSLHNASQLSAERIVSDLREKIANGLPCPQPGWDIRIIGGHPIPIGNQALADALRRAGLAAEAAQCPVRERRGDVLPEEMERQWFPDDDPRDIADWHEEIREAAARAIDLGVIRAEMERSFTKSRGNEVGDGHALVLALKAEHAPPWEQAVQRWVEAAMPGPRTYYRPSRRGADRADVVLPGRKREGWTLHLVLDTSGSMIESLPMILGAISAFCADVNIDLVHILQCDVEVSKDEWVTPEDLANFEIQGYGGSDMTPAMMRLAQDAEVEVVIVLTDGWISYPATPMPYEVLWVLDYENAFSPEYGQVMALNP